MVRRLDTPANDKSPRPNSFGGAPGWTPKFAAGFAHASTDAGALLTSRNETVCGDAINCGYVPQVGMYAVLHFSGEHIMTSEQEIDKLFHRAVFRLDLAEAIKDVLFRRKNKPNAPAHQSREEAYVHSDDFL